ncbi:hypothetical protein CAPTEDRAFT_216914 [Capitella teleta]|uniref:CCHC-type domain-containing protein n=1 Tax=Capitella teleta TaxID=283909 RepID=R7VD92_CAPTE|nr:hypothetical protein CAPTEDRAFT_216914 [Capitella teleta]|eukprot:ELU14261.1 hypothetical protein CAPTEDRAFT_216914 [Capitella teleta]
MSAPQAVQSVHAFNSKYKKKPFGKFPGENKTPNKSTGQCPNCTKEHPPGRNTCPARESSCAKCKKKGHWAAKCRGSTQAKTHKKKVHELTYTSEYDDEVRIQSVSHTNKARTEAYTHIKIPASIGKEQAAIIRAKVDTGASGNVLPVRVFSQIHPQRMKNGQNTKYTSEQTHYQ